MSKAAKSSSRSALKPVAKRGPDLVRQAMEKNGRGNVRVHVPEQYARAEWSVKNPPSLVGLKLLTLMIAASGGDLAGFKEFPLALLREVPTLANGSRVEFRAELERLMSAQVSAPSERVNGLLVERFGSVVRDVRLTSDASGKVINFGFFFGETFLGMVASGEYYTMLDASIIMALRSRYAILLYQFLASQEWRDDYVILSLADARRVFALADDKFEEFRRFKREVIVPACEEVSEKSNWIVKPTAVYSPNDGRLIDRVRFDIETKMLPVPAAGGAAPAAASSGETKPKRGRGRPPKALAAPAAASASEAAILEFWAAALKDGGRRPLGGDITPEMGRQMLARGLAVPELLKARGVCFNG